MKIRKSSYPTTKKLNSLNHWSENESNFYSVLCGVYFPKNSELLFYSTCGRSGFKKLHCRWGAISRLIMSAYVKGQYFINQSWMRVEESLRLLNFSDTQIILNVNSDWFDARSCGESANSDFPDRMERLSKYLRNKQREAHLLKAQIFPKNVGILLSIRDAFNTVLE